jgi:predicted helicase
MPRSEVMSLLIDEENIAISLCRQVISDKWEHIAASQYIVDDSMVSNKTRERGYVFPLYKIHNGQKVINISEKAKNIFLFDDQCADENILYYIYAILHSDKYIFQFNEILKKDFPKIPIPESKDYFLRLAARGKELVAYHTLTHPALADPENWITQYPVADNSETANTVADGYPSYADGKVSINPKQHFSRVPEEVWNYVIGGYQPAQKWLKDRRGRKLLLEDIQTYQQIILALSETIRLRTELDAVVGKSPEKETRQK